MPRNLKRGPQFPVSISIENIGEDQEEKGLHVFRRPIYHPKSSEDKKSLHVLNLYFSGGGGRDPSGQGRNLIDAMEMH